MKVTINRIFYILFTYFVQSIEPCPLFWKVMEEEKVAEKQGWCTKKQQQQLLSFETITGLRKFTRGGVLNAVTKLIATNNEVSHYRFITQGNS